MRARAHGARPRRRRCRAARRTRPRNGHAYHGVSDTGSVADFDTFADQVGAHPAVLQDFFHWRVPLTTGALYRWGATDTRGVLSLSTATGDGEEMITPRQIARGKDDRYMTHMAADIAETGQTVYIRLMAEMNGHWNAYSAYNADGTARRHGHSARWYKLAWRRFTLILRGGSRDQINRKLRADGPAADPAGEARRTTRSTRAAPTASRCRSQSRCPSRGWR